jgi:hypothetical protein
MFVVSVRAAIGAGPRSLSVEPRRRGARLYRSEQHDRVEAVRDCGAELDLAVVGGDQALHDREAKAGSFPAARAPEAVERTRPLGDD